MTENTDFLNIDAYQSYVRSMPKAGNIVLYLLNPQPQEKILDLGCGDGTLTEKIQSNGCYVLGIDSSPAMIKTCETRDINTQIMDARHLVFNEEFDAVFSHAVLHWIEEAEMVVEGVARALKKGGRFVAECGGICNTNIIESTLIRVISNAGYSVSSPWYDLEPETYKKLLEKHGFQVELLHIMPKSAPLHSGMRVWLETFTGQFMADVPPEIHADIYDKVENELFPILCDNNGLWHADYVRLWIKAIKTT